MVGSHSGSPEVSLAVRWTSGVPLILGVLPGDVISIVNAVSGDGVVVVGTSTFGNQDRAFRWTEAGGMQPIGFLPNQDQSTATAVNQDGTVIVGTGSSSANPFFRTAFRWVNGVMQDLGQFPPGSSVPYDVSADGSTVVGTSNALAFRWTQATGLVNISAGSPSPSSVAYATNADGTVVTGSGASLFRWSVSNGWQELGLLPTGNSAEGRAITADGNTIVGRANSFQGQRAILRTAATGIVDLNTYLPLRGLDTSGWQLTEATGISADGSAIAGNGLYLGLSRAWLVTGLGSGESCPADFNNSGSATVQDIFDFLAAYFAGCA